jgi:hypothetical protein
MYPLQMGSPNYAIGSPLFKKATINLENGKKVVINAPNNSASNVYVQGLKVNGRAYGKTYLPHSILADGAVLDYTMGATPSTWGTGATNAPPSITQGNAVPKPLRDATRPGNGVATASGGVPVDGLFDNSSSSPVRFPTRTPWIQYQFTSASRELITYYTLTSNDANGDPKSWVLKGSRDGNNWTVVDQRTNESFPWRLQTRPFKIAQPDRYSYYRLEVTDAANSDGTLALAQIELMSIPAVAPTCSTRPDASCPD